MITINYENDTWNILEYKHHIQFNNDKKTIQELIYHWENGNLNLSPVFQRDSVWSEIQRRKLVRSIYENIPIPSIYLYERFQDNRTVYDVIDGKQRLETIFRFIGVKGFKKKSFWFKTEWMEEGNYNHDYCTWRDLEDIEKQHILDYPIQTITVKGSQSDIAEIFVRINSTGSKLTAQEIRDAKYLKSPFLQEIHKIGKQKWIQEFFKRNRILSSNRLTRKKHIELISELIISINSGGPVNKKKAIEDAMKMDVIRGNHLNNLSKEFKSVLKTIESIFPNFRSTRFIGLTDFYTLFLLVWKWKFQRGFVLKVGNASRLAEYYLVNFSNKIDIIREKQKKLQKIDEFESVYSDYLRTVQSGTDDITNRKRRETILDNLLSDCFSVKDPFRTFNKEQRRIIWNNSNHRCKVCKCKLTFNNFHADHIKPHSRAGRTSVKNAQVLCSKHNLEKS